MRVQVEHTSLLPPTVGDEEKKFCDVGYSSRDWYGSNVGSSAYGAGWKLPDKLRIVKPLEGSLTLHNW